MALGRRRKRNAFSNQIFPIFVGAAAFAVAIWLTYMSISQTPAVYDTDTLCLVDKPPNAILAIIIDGTDTIPPIISKKANLEINKAIDAASPNTLVNLYTISSSATDYLSPVISLCKPRDGSSADELSECPGCMEKRFSSQFKEPIEQILESLLTAQPASRSPILESIKDVVVDSFIGRSPDTPKQLLIVSDLIQHSNFYSFYTDVPDIDEFESALVSKGVGSMDLMGAEINFLVVPRPRSADSFADVARFWREFLMHQNAGLGSTWEPL